MMNFAALNQKGKHVKIIEQSHKVLNISMNLLEQIELAARTCYKSEDKIEKDSAKKLIEKLMYRQHNAMLEFGDIIVKFITNRSVTHELVRHRLCSFAQESQRYIKYNNIEFIQPVWMKSIYLNNTFTSEDLICYKSYNPEHVFIEQCIKAEIAYQKLLKLNWKPEQAREILPNAIKTEIVVKANTREWIHILNLRCSKKAHPQIQSLMKNLLIELNKEIPVIFNELHQKYILENNDNS